MNALVRHLDGLLRHLDGLLRHLDDVLRHLDNVLRGRKTLSKLRESGYSCGKDNKLSVYLTL